AGHPHLLDGLLADDRLVEQDVVEDGPQGVLGVLTGRGVLDGLADGHPERTGAVGSRSEYGPAVVGGWRGAGHDLRAVRLHEDPPVRLLVVAGANHVDLDLEPEIGARKGQGTPPLTGAGLG